MTENKKQQDTPLANSSQVELKASKVEDAQRAVPGKVEAPQDAELLMVPLEALSLAPDRPAKAVDTSEDAMRVTDANITDLRKSGHGINSSGILQPLSVVPDPEKGEGHFLIVDGAQRWSAARLAGMPAVPVLVDKSSSRKDTFEKALMMNIVRQNMNIVDEAEALYELMKRSGDTKSLAKVAVRLGISNSKGWGQSRKELAESSQELKEIVRENPKRFSHVIQVLRNVDDADLLQELIAMTRAGAPLDKVKARWKAALKEQGGGEEIPEPETPEPPKPSQDEIRMELLKYAQTACEALSTHADKFPEQNSEDAKWVAAQRKTLLEIHKHLNKNLKLVNFDDVVDYEEAEEA